MHYTPGPKAKAEYRAFTKRGGPQVLEIEQPSPAPPPPSGLTPLEEELINRGVTASTARKLVAEYPEERIRRQLEHADFLVETGAKEISNRGAYLAKAMREDFAPPPGFEPQAVRAKRQEAQGAKRRREQEEARRRRAEQAREQAEQARILEYWNGLDPDEQRRLEAEALEQSEEPAASTYREMLGARNPLAPSALRCIREAHIRNLLATAPPTPAQ